MTRAPFWLIPGDCREAMSTLEAGSVQCCVTSPPYYGLRDYGHEGQIGLESTPDEYVARLIDVFREVRRVLSVDGTLWLNLGDSYAANRPYQVPSTKGGAKHSESQAVGGKAATVPDGLKPKDLIGIPWRVAFALQADGWYLRQDIIWHKPNPMPESVTDRCTKAHEYVFLLSKSARYYYDHDAVKEPAVGRTLHDRTGQGYAAPGQTPHMGNRSARDSFKREGSKREQAIPAQSVGTHRPDRVESQYDTATRNRRSVWTIATKPYAGAHFAVMPPDLVEPCILAGCPVDGLVLDPFTGSGTVGMVAVALGRRFVGAELNPEYLAMAEARINGAVQERAEAARQVSMFGAAK